MSAFWIRSKRYIFLFILLVLLLADCVIAGILGGVFISILAGTLYVQVVKLLPNNKIHAMIVTLLCILLFFCTYWILYEEAVISNVCRAASVTSFRSPHLCFAQKRFNTMKTAWNRFNATYRSGNDAVAEELIKSVDAIHVNDELSLSAQQLQQLYPAKVVVGGLESGQSDTWRHIINNYPELTYIALYELERKEWWGAQQTDTILGYRNYLDVFPSGSHAEEAKSRIDELGKTLAAQEKAAWTTAEQTDTFDGYRTYLKAFPSGGHAEEAKTRIVKLEEALAARDEAAWTAAQQADTLDGYRSYLRAFPSGAHAMEAQIHIVMREQVAEGRILAAQDEAAWTAAQQANTPDGYRGYLTAFPSGAHVENARSQITKLQQAAEEEAAWGAAQKADTLDGYGNYLKAFPSGAHVENARSQITKLQQAAEDEAAWAAAQQADTLDGYGDYLKAFPSGAHATEAKSQIAKLAQAIEEEAAWGTAQRANTLDGYRDYLKAFPSGAHATEAKDQIAKLQTSNGLPIIGPLVVPVWSFTRGTLDVLFGGH